MPNVFTRKGGNDMTKKRRTMEYEESSGNVFADLGLPNPDQELLKANLTLQIFRAIKAGAQAYVIKNLVHKELLQTIRTVHAGRKTMSPEVAAQVAAYAGEEALTSREIDVLRLIAAGSANKEIAAQLSITEETVKSRVKNILLKLGANDRTHAVTIGLKRGIIDL